MQASVRTFWNWELKHLRSLRHRVAHRLEFPTRKMLEVLLMMRRSEAKVLSLISVDWLLSRR